MLTQSSTELPLLQAQRNSTLLLVMTSEQPLCGGFNQEVLALAERQLRQLRDQNIDTHLVVVGHRGVRQLIVRGIVPDNAEAAATTVHGLRDVVKRLATLVDRRFGAGQLGSLRAIYNSYRSISEQVPCDDEILPIDLAAIRKLAGPVNTSFDRQLPDATLLAGLISQYAFIRLYRIAADSFASEQASRLTAMDGATRNTQKMLDSFIALEQRERQDEITRQMLELVASRFADG